MQRFMVDDKKYGFYSECNKKWLKASEQESETM